MFRSTYLNKFLIVMIYLFSFLFLSILFVTSMCYFQYGDDFVFLLGIKENGVFGNLWFKYLNWDGRHLSLGGLIQSLYFRFASPFMSIWLGIAGYFVSLLLILKTFDFEFNIRKLIIVFSLLIIGLLPFFKDIILWQTGVVYSIFLLQTCLSFYLYLRKDLNHWLFLIILLILSINSQNLNFSFGTFVIVNSFFRIYNISKIKEIISIFALVIGTLIVSLAPGNSSRIDFMDALIPENTPFFSLLIDILYKSLTYSKYCFISGLFAGFLISKKFPSIQGFFLFIVLGFVTILPFFVVQKAFSIRVLFSVAFFCFFAGLEFTSWIKSKYFINPMVFRSLILFFLVVGNIILFKQYLLYRELSNKVQLREIYLENLPSQSVAKYPYIPLPEGLFITRCPSYEDLWSSEFLEYYDLKKFVQF